MTELARQAKLASRALARLTTEQKDAALRAMADALDAATPELIQANLQDLVLGRSLGLSEAMLDRLTLNEKRITAMANGVREVAALPDPVGRILDERARPNGLRLQKVSTPLGVVVIIYESRPNVTADAASLCFKTGNATILRGGKEALNSNRLIAQHMVDAGRRVLGDAFPAAAIQVVSTTDRDAVPALLSLTQYVDLCMPRGGEGLIRAVTACAKVPVIKHYKGVCHVYVDRDAELSMAEQIIFNAKCQRPSACNAAETLLIDRVVAAQFLPQIVARLAQKKVEFHADPEALPLVRAGVGKDASVVRPATEEDYSTEYNDQILNVRVVDDVAAAIEHIHRYGSAHSDTIVTRNEATARRFLADVDSAAVYWNASTRFTDGGEFGMGAEIGISTDKIGARGPMGLEELCTYKWLGLGTGQIRE
ncbi:MAG TPA: glutamate-5-semialdehyde dehydrogenase [Verrucomicrobiota bacterium]|nr:glutamate-5-semialdehyde dehydrogenase [Verrucomicrobiales bacterium]HRI11369.1 glutamate-5-semialdehyde dehydrogenase [Verrucomicrobiota bacterium]